MIAILGINSKGLELACRVSKSLNNTAICNGLFLHNKSLNNQSWNLSITGPGYERGGRGAGGPGGPGGRGYVRGRGRMGPGRGRGNQNY